MDKQRVTLKTHIFVEFAEKCSCSNTLPVRFRSFDEKRDIMDGQGNSSNSSTTAGAQRPNEESLPSSDARIEEDTRPSALRPQVMPTAEIPSMSPRLREQVLPEKGDHRFFDRWVVDKARQLGARAVRRSVLEKLRRVVHAFAEWRSLRYAPAAERDSIPDRVIVASERETIQKAEGEHVRLSARADAVELEAKRHREQAERAEGERAALPPALRGTKDLDLVLVTIANLVVLAVDVFIIHIALELVPGSDREHWITAITMGGGAVVVGDVLGWMAAAGSIRKDGVLGRPGNPVIVGVSGLLAVAVVFFVLLGRFREKSLDSLSHRGPHLGNTTFFTLAQILFLLGAAVACFAYMARRAGRELLETQRTAREKCDSLSAEARALRGQAERARQVAEETPARCREAKARIVSREKIAAGEAKMDLKQGRYLESLVDPEYMAERADVESGVRFWQFERGQRLTGLPVALRYAAIAAGALVAGGVAFWIARDPIAPILVTIIVGLGLVYAFGGDRNRQQGEGRDRPDPYQRYVAEMVASARTGSDRSTDIERLVPFPPTSVDAEQPDNGGSRDDLLTEEQWEQIMSRMLKVKGDDA